jgi:hypothetical protein
MYTTITITKFESSQSTSQVMYMTITWNNYNWTYPLVWPNTSSMAQILSMETMEGGSDQSQEERERGMGVSHHLLEQSEAVAGRCGMGGGRGAGALTA